MPITDLQISGTGTEPINVKLLVTSGTLSMSTTTGLTFDGSSSGSTIYFSGTLTNINNALATLTYTRASTGTDTLEVSLVPRGEVFFTDNNHLYKFISGTITANSARTSAAAQTAYGATGYLATITSQAENDFVANRLQGDGWIGGSDATSEGTWKWITGPETDTTFWSGASGGSTVGGNYANWASGEPNDWGGNEDCIQFYITSRNWNDLPCTGNTLSGYVVEFGAPGDLPSVVAKNISITTSNAPTVNTFSPLDNATNISTTSNLTLTFNQTITKGTGNILIKKTSDNSTVETIDVTSSQVTGQSTSTITIDPNTTLDENTSYYITIPNTAFKNGSNAFYTGISTTTGWNFTTGDFTNPGLSSITATSISNSGATITWASTESSSSRVTYGLTTSYGTQTSETDTSPRVTSHSVALTGLLACTTYHYTVTSRDASSNSSTSSDNSFTTTGCEASQTPVDTNTETITTTTGGTTTLEENNNELTVQAPGNFTTAASSVVIQIKAVESSPVLSATGKPTEVPLPVGNIVFDVKAIINGTTVLDSFDQPVTITYHYTDADIVGIKEETLRLYHYHNNTWEELDSCYVNQTTNTISCTTDSFSIFALFGKSINSPTAQVATTNNGPATCGSSVPSTPTLFQIDAAQTQAKVYLSPVSNPVTNYFISYGYSPNEERFGTFTNLNQSTGVLSYTVNFLSANTTYYFKLRAYNDCMPGNWSNEMKITTHKRLSGSTVYYKNSPTHTLSVFPSPLKNIPSVLISQNNTSRILGATTGTTCEYTVQSGDSLWTIASQKLGAGWKYQSIMEQNNLNSTFLKTGSVLRIGC